MQQRILLGIPSSIIRRGIRDFFSHEERNAFIDEANSSDEFAARLANHPYDVIVVHQAFLKSVSPSPGRKIIVLASQPSKELYLVAHERYAMAYLRDDPSEHLLHEIMHRETGGFLLDPTFYDWFLEQFGEKEKQRNSLKGFTAREQEIANLRNKGLSYEKIAERLCITVSTVKRHVANMRGRTKKI